MTSKRKFSINLGVHGQLNHDTLADALLGIDYHITKSSSAWGWGQPAPNRYYMTGFLFVDSNKLPLIGPDEKSSVSLSRIDLPAYTDEFFEEEIGKRFKGRKVAWEPKSPEEIHSLFLFIHYGLGSKFMTEVKKNAAARLRDRICEGIGELVALRNDKRATVFSKAKISATKDELLNAGRLHMEARDLDNEISSMERAHDIVGQLPSASFIIVQVKPAERKQK